MFALIVSPRGTATFAREQVNAARSGAMPAATVVLADLVEPETFARVGGPYYNGAMVTLAHSEEPRFPMLADAWKPSPFAAGKIAMKIDHEPVASMQRPRVGPSPDVAAADLRDAARADAPLNGGTRDFQRVKVAGATLLQADNIRIVLAGVEPLPQEATCRRLDGVMQSCIERAEHRLAVLLQARGVSCQLSKQLDNGLFLGRCLADKIDIAADLMRHKLVQRRGATLSASAM